MVSDPENYFEPLWMNMNQVHDLVLYPLEVKKQLLRDFKNNFKDIPRQLKQIIM